MRERGGDIVNVETGEISHLATHKLAVERLLHQSSEQLLSQDLLSNLHQLRKYILYRYQNIFFKTYKFVVADKDLDSTKLEDHKGSEDLPCCLGLESCPVVLQYEAFCFSLLSRSSIN